MWDLFIQNFKTLIYNPGIIKNESEKMFLTADAFTKSCEILVFKFSHDKKTMPIVPMITNIAFACELYLKYLLSINGIEPPIGNNGHNFKILINLLPDDYKKDLIKRICISYNEVTFENFNDKIEPIKKCFSSWRYIHEAKFEKDIDLELLVKLMLTLQIICNEELEKIRSKTGST